jgi:hypothetical protein
MFSTKSIEYLMKEKQGEKKGTYNTLKYNNTSSGRHWGQEGIPPQPIICGD